MKPLLPIRPSTGPLGSPALLGCPLWTPRVAWLRVYEPRQRLRQSLVTAGTTAHSSGSPQPPSPARGPKHRVKNPSLQAKRLSALGIRLQTPTSPSGLRGDGGGAGLGRSKPSDRFLQQKPAYKLGRKQNVGQREPEGVLTPSTHRSCLTLHRRQLPRLGFPVVGAGRRTTVRGPL